MIKLSLDTIISHTLGKVLDEWAIKVPNEHLEEYLDWRTDLVERLEKAVKRYYDKKDEMAIEDDKSTVKKEEPKVELPKIEIKAITEVEPKETTPNKLGVSLSEIIISDKETK